MDPIVDLAPGADESVLARFFSERVRDTVRNAKRRATFFSLKATIFVVDFDSGSATTLRFDHGRLTIHDGTIGMPSVTIGGPLHALLSLDRIRFADIPRALFGKRFADVALVEGADNRPSSPPPSSVRRSQPRRADAAELLSLFGSGEIKIYGLLSHPRTVIRFLRIISELPP